MARKPDSWPYASAEDKARHSRGLADRHQQMIDDLTAVFDCIDAGRDAASSAAFAADWDRTHPFDDITPDMDPAMNAAHVDMVREKVS